MKTLYLGAALLLAGCGEGRRHSSYVDTPVECTHKTVFKGMSVEEVVALCGLPFERNTDNHSSQWVYNTFDVADPQYVYFDIDNKVSDVQWSDRP